LIQQQEKGNSMSQENYFGLALKATLENNPEVFDLTGLDEQLAKAHKERQALNAKNEEAKPKQPAAKQLRDLKNQLWLHTRACKDSETLVNNHAADVVARQLNIEDLLKRKKNADGENRLGDVRSLEGQIERVEEELADARIALAKAQKFNHATLAQKRAWHQANDERLNELQKIV
jgi:hypothetical protein